MFLGTVSGHSPEAHETGKCFRKKVCPYQAWFAGSHTDVSYKRHSFPIVLWKIIKQKYRVRHQETVQDESEELECRSEGLGSTHFLLLESESLGNWISLSFVLLSIKRRGGGRGEEGGVPTLTRVIELFRGLFSVSHDILNWMWWFLIEPPK